MIAAGADAFASELATTIASQYGRVRAFFSATAATKDGFADNATDALFANAGNAWPTIGAIGIANSATQRSSGGAGCRRSRPC